MIALHHACLRRPLALVALGVSLCGCTGTDAGGSSSGGSSSSSGGGSSSSGGNSGGGSSSSGGNSGGGSSSSGGGSSSSGGSSSGGSSGAGTGSVAATGGTRASGGTAATGGSGGTSCPYTGHITYTLAKSSNPTATEQAAYALITTAMDKAIAFYNCYTNITKAENVSYNTSVTTADGNINGSIRFGADTTYMDFRTAMHEISHTVGIGQASNWTSFVENGLFTGSNAVAQLAAINATLTTPLDTVLHADSQHFWPYGINQKSEVKSEADLTNIVGHCQMVMAIRKDLGLK